MVKVMPLKIQSGEKFISVIIGTGSHDASFFVETVEQLAQIAEPLYGAYLVEKAKAAQANEL